MTIIIPAIRQNHWKLLIDSIDIKKYSFEIILASPFDWPSNCDKPTNVKILKTYDTPSVATQKGLLESHAELVWFTVDDCVMFPGAIDKAMDFYYNNCGEKDVINMTYREGAQFSGYELPKSFWFMGSHADLKLPGIQPYWKIALQPLLNREYLIDLGGLDTRFIYSNHSFHDLAARIQRDGGKYYDSPTTVSNANHYPGISGDHKPIHESQILHDQPLFEELYSKENYRIKIDLNNYKRYEGVWKKRFKHQYETYQEMARSEGYNI